MHMGAHLDRRRPARAPAAARPRALIMTARNAAMQGAEAEFSAPAGL